MSHAISRDIIVQTILAGAKEASAAYQRLSGGYWVDFAPESFLQAWIALAFDKLKKKGAPFRLMLEMSPTLLAREFKVEIDTGRIGMRPKQRFDLMLLYQNCNPRSPIEIKKAYTSNACDKDAERMREWIHSPSSTVDCGFIVAYTCAKSEAVISRRFKSMAKNTGASHYERIVPREIDHNGYMWDVACFMIT